MGRGIAHIAGFLALSIEKSPNSGMNEQTRPQKSLVLTKTNINDFFGKQEERSLSGTIRETVSVYSGRKLVNRKEEKREKLKMKMKLKLKLKLSKREKSWNFAEAKIRI